jgi:hypothetical protein
MKITGTHNIRLLTHNPTRQSFLIARFRRTLLALALLSFISLSLSTRASAQEEQSYRNQLQRTNRRLANTRSNSSDIGRCIRYSSRGREHSREKSYKDDGELHDEVVDVGALVQ